MKRIMTIFVFFAAMWSCTLTVSAKNTSVHIMNVPASAESVRVNLSNGTYLNAQKKNDNGFWSASDNGSNVIFRVSSLTIFIDGIGVNVPRSSLKIGTESGGTVKITVLSVPSSTTAPTTAAPTTTAPTTAAPTTDTNVPTLPPFVTVTTTREDVQNTSGTEEAKPTENETTATVTHSSAMPTTSLPPFITETTQIEDVRDTLTLFPTTDAADNEKNTEPSSESSGVNNPDNDNHSPQMGADEIAPVAGFVALVICIAAIPKIVQRAKLKKSAKQELP